MYFNVQHSADGFVLAESGKGLVVYTYAADTKGHAATCTGACAAAWPPVKAQNPQPSPADNLPGGFSVINGQVAYNGMPLYTFAGEKSLSVHAGGQWKVVPMSASYIKTGA
jgi:predicted lipoprotein with Yx(FWY)xxD motif